MKPAFLALSATLALTACEGGGDPVQQALREESAANHAEVALAREAQAERRAETASAEQEEIARLRRNIAVAEAALEGSDDPELSDAAEEAIETSRQALADLGVAETEG